MDWKDRLEGLRPYLMKIVRNNLRCDAETAEDVVQRTYLRCLQGEYDQSRAELKTWVVGTAVWMCREVQRERRLVSRRGRKRLDVRSLDAMVRLPALGEADNAVAWEPPDLTDFESTAIALCDADEVERLVGAMSENRQRAFWLNQFGYTNKEVAEHLGCSESRVYQYLTEIKAEVSYKIFEKPACLA